MKTTDSTPRFFNMRCGRCGGYRYVVGDVSALAWCKCDHRTRRISDSIDGSLADNAVVWRRVSETTNSCKTIAE